MSRAAEFWEAWLLIAIALIAAVVWVLWIHPSPVSSPGDGGGVPAVTETAGASTHQ